MKYYVIADPHGFYTEMHQALDKAGFFSDTEPHKLVLCGDMLDRGGEARKMVRFMADLLDKDQLIYILGNHEDLFVKCLQLIARGDISEIMGRESHHYTNGTLGSLLQLALMNFDEANDFPSDLVRRVRLGDFYSKLLRCAVDYFETDNYVFCHGWIPVEQSPEGNLSYRADWRDASTDEWARARWLHGIELAVTHKILEPNKTIVCGHWHTSWGHSVLHKEGEEWGPSAIFAPFYDEGIIALDGCTSYSRIVNCIVIED